MRYLLLSFCAVVAFSLAGCVTVDGRPVYGASKISNSDLQAALSVARSVQPNAKIYAVRVVSRDEVRFHTTPEEDDHYFCADRMNGSWTYSSGPVITGDPVGYHLLPDEA